MAWKKQFRCKQCGYEADVYEGRGFMGQHISTMTCPTATASSHWSLGAS